MDLWLISGILGLLYFFYYHLVGKRRKLPPGPTPLPFLGNVADLDPKNIEDNLARLSKKYGNIITIWIGNKPAIFINDFGTIKEYMSGKTAELLTGRPDNYTFDVFYGKRNAGIIFSTGEKWREQRRFSLHTLRDFGIGRSLMEDGIREQADHMVQLIRAMTKENNGQVNLHEPVSLAVTNIISKIVLGKVFPEASDGLKLVRKAVDDNIEIISTPEAFLLSIYPFLRFVPLFGHFGYDRLTKNSDVFWTYLEKEYKRVKDEFDPANEPESYTEAFIKEMRRREQSGDVGSFDDFQGVRAIGDFWSAGFETTVTTLRWAFLYMACYPDVQEKIHQEIDAYYIDSSKPIQMADRQSVPFTSATVLECQRLANILPINVQHSNTEDLHVDDYFFPKGTIFIPQISSVMKDPKIFEFPNELRPERFLEDGKLKNVPELIPFSIGKRICAGEALARMELFMLFVAVMREFKISSISGKRPSMQPALGFTRKPKPYEIHITPK